MSPAGSLHLAWRYVAHHRVRTLLLALALGLTLALPLAVRALMEIAQREYRARAGATPLVLGAKGSALELTLNALYFRRRGVELMPVKHVDALRESGLAKVIPIYARFHAQEAPVVGTSLDYFEFRGLKIADGKMITRLGDCVLGGHVARKRGLHPGDHLSTSPEQVFDIAGVYPVKMRVTGVLADSHSPDDDAVFVDVKTTWLIEGIAHGHDDVVQSNDATTVLEKKDGNVAATNAVRMFTEVTPENLPSFHFHGDVATYPLTAAIALPHDARSQAMLLGRYQDGQRDAQLVQPLDQMDALLASLFQAERLTLLLLVTLGTAVLFIAALVFALSFKMRQSEFKTLEEIGVGRGTVALVKSFEVLLVGVASSVMVVVVWWLVRQTGPALVRALLQ
jgi:putative ABC transport system permease protein